MAVLITGAGGFIGGHAARRLSGAHEVICLSRGKPQAPGTTVVRGSFDSFEDLRQLDDYAIDTAVHLAAVTGGCSEEEGLAVNVLGTRRLFRYLLDRGCRKFVSASSIAAVGCLDPQFVPDALPIPDDHPCLATDAYGMSKAMVEQLSSYFHRIHPDSAFIHLRLGAVIPDEFQESEPASRSSVPRIPFASLGLVLIGDVIRALATAVEAPARPGVKVFNVVGPDASCDIPTVDMLQAVLGDKFHSYDLSYYRQAGCEHKPLYAMDRIREEWGFVPQLSTRPAERRNRQPFVQS